MGAVGTRLLLLCVLLRVQRYRRSDSWRIRIRLLVFPALEAYSTIARPGRVQVPLALEAERVGKVGSACIVYQRSPAPE